MPMFNVKTVRRGLEWSLRRKENFAPFWDWLASWSWNMDRYATPKLKELVYGIKLTVYEHTSPHVPDLGWEYLRERLSRFVPA